MDCKDIERKAIMLKRKVKCDYQEQWLNSDFKIK